MDRIHTIGELIGEEVEVVAVTKKTGNRERNRQEKIKKAKTAHNKMRGRKEGKPSRSVRSLDIPGMPWKRSEEGSRRKRGRTTREEPKMIEYRQDNNTTKGKERKKRKG